MSRIFTETFTLEFEHPDVDVEPIEESLDPDISESILPETYLSLSYDDLVNHGIIRAN